MPRPITRSKFVSPKLSASLGQSGFWDRLCTIQAIDTEDRDSFGETDPEMIALYTDVPARVAHQTKSGAGQGAEKETSAGAVIKTTLAALLNQYCPLITEDSTVLINGEAKSFEVEKVEHSSDHSFTRLLLERIKSEQEGEAP